MLKTLTTPNTDPSGGLKARNCLSMPLPPTADFDLWCYLHLYDSAGKSAHGLAASQCAGYYYEWRSAIGLGETYEMWTQASAS